ncbi:bifunctional adenosylcobinamide kinase/adenosylcobinamide-phosphate guanylyltransferase [Paenibacillus turpanensis]|uniref:bifunctional adenosylcobinamide kinase/adenosylcobinamide-phosphate guanylyltransferase n=1 Tax=Paenibacillus turpanensis TaxID=2689078 RepID=UPI00140D0441|nr:bifunctional adenosylcobinamide kinase/adenosylcobinamide-phosphate guanylyltransferase [Paenibacillus turpanensis]
MVVLVTGGARSGKSSFAEKYAAKLGSEGIYVATAQAYDEEMQHRIALHAKRRNEAGFPWLTVEKPFELAELLQQINKESNLFRFEKRVILVDCMTLWLSNWLLRFEHEEQCEEAVMQKIERMCEVLRDYQGPVVLVTNEVGYGIVPEYKLGRRFRDLSGWMNQRLASISKEVFLVTAGIPIELKKQAYRFEG